MNGISYDPGKNNDTGLNRDTPKIHTNFAEF